MKDYLDIGILADYFRSKKRSISNKSLRNSTAFSEYHMLQGEYTSVTMQGKRALALVFALEARCSPTLNTLAYANEHELCFQLYAVRSQGMHDLVPFIIQRNDLCAEELAILAYFLKNEFLPGVSKENTLWILQERFENEALQNREIIGSDAFTFMSNCAQTKTPMLQAWHDCMYRPWSMSKRSAQYFTNLGMTNLQLLTKLYFANSNVPVEKELLQELLDSCPIWTDDEYKLVKQLLSRNVCQHRIARYDNFKRLYEDPDIHFRAGVFRVGLYETRGVKKLNLLNWEDRISVMQLAFRSLEEVPAWMLCKTFDQELYAIFSQYDKDFQVAWEKSQDYLLGMSHPIYIRTFLQKQDTLSDFTDFLNTQTFDLFLEHTREIKVRAALMKWCKNKQDFSLLKPKISAFGKDLQDQIEKDSNKIALGLHSSLSEESPYKNLDVSLQVFASNHEMHFKALSKEEQQLLGSVITDDCIQSEEEIVASVKAAEDSLVLKQDILKACLAFGSKWSKQYIHYFVDLQGWYDLLDPKIVCNEDFIYVQHDQSLEEASYYKGRSFKHDLEQFQEFDGKTLDFFQWYGSDACDTTGLDAYYKPALRCIPITGFTKFFVKKYLGHNIDDWRIYQNSVLCNAANLRKIVWDENTKLLCRNSIPEVLQDDFPSSLYNLPKTASQCSAIIANLKRHPLEWYKRFTWWKPILLYDFEWNEVTCKYYETIYRLGVKTMSELFILVCDKLVYPRNVNHFNKLITQL